MNKRHRLIHVLISWHWKNLVRDNEKLDITQMRKRLDVILYLKARLPAKTRIDLSLHRT